VALASIKRLKHQRQCLADKIQATVGAHRRQQVGMADSSRAIVAGGVQDPVKK
jgi:hypothetical protein